MGAAELTGGCQCGAVRYRITALPLTLYCCHCTECQAQAASAFGMSLRCDAASVDFEGQTAHFVRDAGKATAGECHFCPTCGTRLFHRRDDKAIGISIKAGSLDKPLPYAPVGHIWTASKQNWVVLPEGPLNYPGQPESFKALFDAFARRYGP